LSWKIFIMVCKRMNEKGATSFDFIRFLPKPCDQDQQRFACWAPGTVLQQQPDAPSYKKIALV
jgi:hypothetical protein